MQDLTTFEWLIGLLLGAVLLSALARRIIGLQGPGRT
ncbi:hypothetical protein SAMN05444159_4815 [Bradyrhizobium lablabi]|uniref:Uncharacterized protein n=1 Tax=Bradyrhizobium lablabi TaxID=722472 RepID=A0A1M6XAM9_9BRAD|nr:hypothetical protein SAMN05444159_4815 [Bradyrhizobium lablabi]